MRRAFIWLSLVGGLAVAWSAQAATGRVIKVLPQFLDLKGRNSLTPSLYERDLYQAFLREHTNQCSGMRFNVQWKAKGQPAAPLKLRVELRGVARGDFPKQLVLEKPVEPGGWFSHWTEITWSARSIRTSAGHRLAGDVVGGQPAARANRSRSSGSAPPAVLRSDARLAQPRRASCVRRACS